MIDFEWTTFLILGLAAFGAGFVDAVVGGGGFIQIPSLMVMLPQFPVASLLGTNKVISISGTSFAFFRFSRGLKMSLRTLIPCGLAAFAFSAFGSYLVLKVPNDFLRPVFLVILILTFLYISWKGEFGMVTSDHAHPESLGLSLAIGSVIGLYDGFVGPGTGTFLILSFVSLLGIGFVRASAYAKLINLTTNFASILLFLSHGAILWKMALPMAVLNIAGAVCGAHLTLLKGNQFVRVVLRLVILVMILRFGFDVIHKDLSIF